MNESQARALIAPAVTGGGTWADLGAGAGTFTRALASLLGPTGTVYAVDRDAHALAHIADPLGDRGSGAQIRTVVGDFSQTLELPPLDGLVIANALHFVPYADQARVLQQVAAVAKAGAPLVVIEYERRNANQWVPYPVTIAALGQLAQEAGLGVPTPIGTTPSRFSGTIYSAIVRRG